MYNLKSVYQKSVAQKREWKTSVVYTSPGNNLSVVASQTAVQCEQTVVQVQ